MNDVDLKVAKLKYKRTCVVCGTLVVLAMLLSTSLAIYGMGTCL